MNPIHQPTMDAIAALRRAPDGSLRSWEHVLGHVRQAISEDENAHTDNGRPYEAARLRWLDDAMVGAVRVATTAGV
jgi:hypothetical protein